MKWMEFITGKRHLTTDQLLRARKPGVWLVEVTDETGEQLDELFAVMALADKHWFLAVAHNTPRMAEWCAQTTESKKYPGERESDGTVFEGSVPRRDIGFYMTECYMMRRDDPSIVREIPIDDNNGFPPDDWEYCSAAHFWPLPNLILAAKCRTQAEADANLPHLLRCPAAVRFLSCEPLLGAVSLLRVGPIGSHHDYLTGEYEDSRRKANTGGIDWIIVGGESGPGARTCDVDWIRETAEQCRAASVPVFVKQLGSKPVDGSRMAHDADKLPLKLKSAKGGDPSEWPKDLRVRQWPAEILGATQ